ncbi:ATP-binding protein [Candidatus Lokiarchaeum ossiferum]
MNRISFPFSAFLGQNRMKLALILNMIDPHIGGVLLIGQQGTGKSIVARSLRPLLSNIDVNQYCPFHCDPEDNENYCFFCQENSNNLIRMTKKREFITIPLGATSDMMVGSVDLENLIAKGKIRVQPGLLAKAHRGVLYIDEINLLPDNLLDLLLDVVSSKINYIERESLSLSHKSDFIFIGSMNPEEGILRPQILDRFGLIVDIKAPNDVSIRSQITHNAIEFDDNPKKFIEKYKLSQNSLRKRILYAQNLLKDIQFLKRDHFFVSKLVSSFPQLSPRVEFTLLKVSRAIAAYHGNLHITKNHLKKGMHLTLQGKLSSKNDVETNLLLESTFEKIWQNITSFPEFSQNDKKSDFSEKSSIYKSSMKVGGEFRENPLEHRSKDLPELQSGDRNSKDQYSNLNLEEKFSNGLKVGDLNSFKKIELSDLNEIPTYIVERPLNIDVSPILSLIKKNRRIVKFNGRGSRLKILTRSGGRYVFAQKPKKHPNSIAFNATIKNHFISYPSSMQKVRDAVYSSNLPNPSNLAVNLKYEYILEKVNELHAPLSLYFIVDASASMRRILKQTIKVIQSVHAEGYTKKDKISVISFQGKEARILQRPSVSFSVGMKRLNNLKATSYTPLASALNIATTLIRQEQIKGLSIPIILILSDLGANISLEKPALNASSRADFTQIADELEKIAKKIGNRGYQLVIMKPKKSFATRFLGVDQLSVQRIENNFIKYSSAKIFEFDGYDPNTTIDQLKSLMK